MAYRLLVADSRIKCFVVWPQFVAAVSLLAIVMFYRWPNMRIPIMWKLPLALIIVTTMAHCSLSPNIVSHPQFNRHTMRNNICVLIQHPIEYCSLRSFKQLDYQRYQQPSKVALQWLFKGWGQFHDSIAYCLSFHKINNHWFSALKGGQSNSWSHLGRDEHWNWNAAIVSLATSDSDDSFMKIQCAIMADHWSRPTHGSSCVHQCVPAHHNHLSTHGRLIQLNSESRSAAVILAGIWT